MVSIITTVLTGPLDRLLGRKRTMIFAAAVLILGKVWFVIDPFAVGGNLSERGDGGHRPFHHLRHVQYQSQQYRGPDRMAERTPHRQPCFNRR